MSVDFSNSGLTIIKMMEPRTKPPPKTLFNSALPVFILLIGSEPISEIEIGIFYLLYSQRPMISLWLKSW